MFGYKDPSKDAIPYLNQIPGQTNQYYQPYEDAGKNQLPQLQEQYTQGMTNPGGKLNEIGANFQQSPGFQFALQQALQGNNHMSGANGMYGSPEHEQNNMATATGLASQDYNNWLGQATGLYNNAMTGSQGMANQGQNAANNHAEQIAQTLAQQAQLKYTGTQNNNQNKKSMYDSIAKGVGAAFSPWG